MHSAPWLSLPPILPSRCWIKVCVCVLVAQSCLTLCNPKDCSRPGSPVHAILQARMLDWVSIPFLCNPLKTQVNYLRCNMVLLYKALQHIKEWNLIISAKHYNHLFIYYLSDSICWVSVPFGKSVLSSNLFIKLRPVLCTLGDPFYCFCYLKEYVSTAIS